jgi:uncharacterized damage-inducible protein DinB
MNEKVLRENLINALTKEQAHISLKPALENLKPENRNTKPSPDSHSVWELLEHIRITQEDIVQYTLDPNWVSPSWPEGHWPEKKDTIPDEEWNKSISKFDDDLKKLVDIIKDQNIDLTSVIPHTKNHTYLREILIVADHNSHHAGQIIAVRKMIGDWTS